MDEDKAQVLGSHECFILRGLAGVTTPPCFQVDRYKQLLVKQRDIMVALTLRLNERDETVISARNTYVR